MRTTTVTLMILAMSAPAAVAQSPVLLPIADRPSAPAAPPEGWCGESAIQQALLYYGAYVPQADINKAGRPQHPDLYARDIPVALKALGARFVWSDKGRDLPGFINWVKQRISGGRPVLVGVKINPSQHPEWALDHFVLAVGHDARSLTLNTTWNKQLKRSTWALKSTERGLGFANRYQSYFGLAIVGLAHKTAGRTRLTITAQGAHRVAVTVHLTGLTPGARYVIHRSVSVGRKTALRHAFVAHGGTHTWSDSVARHRPAVYRLDRAQDQRNN